MTFREKLQIEHPEKIHSGSWGGCVGCPCSYWYENSEDSLCVTHDTSANAIICAACWDREIPETEPTKNTINEKGETEMEPRNFSSMATMAEAPKRSNISDNMSELRNTLKDIHFKTEEIYCFLFGGERQETLNPTPSCLNEDILLSKELALAIMNKLCQIQEKL